MTENGATNAIDSGAFIAQDRVTDGSSFNATNSGAFTYTETGAITVYGGVATADKSAAPILDSVTGRFEKLFPGRRIAKGTQQKAPGDIASTNDAVDNNGAAANVGTANMRFDDIFSRTVIVR